MPEGWHSHKVRVANGVMIVNHEKLGQNGPAEFGGGLAIYDVSRPSEPKLISKWKTAGRGRASLRFRRPLRLYLADGGGLCRQYRGDPRPRRSEPPRRDRTLVDRGTTPGRRRSLSVEPRSADAALPPSVAARRPPLRQLLASRLFHSRHLGPVAPNAGLSSELESFLSASDPYLPAHSAAPEAAQNHGRRRRGRRKAAPRSARLCLGLRHHRRAQSAADLYLSGGRARP